MQKFIIEKSRSASTVGPQDTKGLGCDKFILQKVMQSIFGFILQKMMQDTKDTT